MTLDDSVRELAREIKRTPTPPTRGTPGLPTLARQQGVVASISAGPPVTVTLTLGGSTVPIPGVRVIDGYNPTAGTTVTVLASADGDLLVIGGESGTSGGAAISWPLTFSGDMGFEPGGVANLALTLKNAPLAVNGVTLSGVISGAAPSIAATGSDTNIPLNLKTKGTGPLQINGDPGTSAYVLTSNGASAAPTWQTAGGGATAFDESLHDHYSKPTAALYETISRDTPMVGTVTPSTGVLWLTAIFIPTGITIGHLVFVNGGTTMGAPTNWWFGLYDKNLLQLALTADQLTSSAWTADTAKSLAIATIASGASTTFTTTYTGLHYLGIMMKSSNTLPQIWYSFASNDLTALSPPLCGKFDTAQSTPPAFPHTAVASALGGDGRAYGYVAT